MGDLYEWLLFAHIVGAMIWIGGLVALATFGIRARRSGDRDTVTRFVGGLRVIGPTILAPSAGLVVVFGLAMVFDSSAWDFGQTWVQLALGLLIAAVVVGAAYLSRVGMSAERAVQAGDHAAAARQLQLWSWGIGAILLLLLVATWDMVFKPGL
jgi:uncharacterized membrane protein